MKNFIVFIIIISVLTAVFSSCVAVSDNQVSSVTTFSSSEEEQTTVSDKIIPDLPERDFKGQEFNFLIMSKAANYKNYCFEIFADQETGEPINDVVYQRNLYLEDLYNFKIKITEPPTKEMIILTRTSILADDQLYQVVMPPISDSAKLAESSMLAEMTDLPYIDLNKPWWDSKLNSYFTINNRLFYATGDMTVLDKNATWAVFFNKKIIGDLSLENPYTLIENNEWTLDKYYEYATIAAKDLDGNGKMEINDMYGVAGEYLNSAMLYYGTGERMIKKDSEDLPYFAMDTERSINAAMKVLTYNSDPNVIMNVQLFPLEDPYTTVLRKTFKEDRALFYVAGLLSFTLLRDMESEFGMLPLPKLDENQADYFAPINAGNGNSVCIPINNNLMEETAFILEAIAAESLYTLTPVYFETALERKYMRDEESHTTLNILLKNRILDFAQMYNWGGSHSFWLNMTQTRNLNVVSEIDKIKDAVINAMQKNIDEYINTP